MTRQDPATTWWLTGLPGAGKTTLAQALATALRERGGRRSASLIIVKNHQKS